MRILTVRHKNRDAWSAMQSMLLDWLRILVYPGDTNIDRFRDKLPKKVFFQALLPPIPPPPKFGAMPKKKHFVSGRP